MFQKILLLGPKVRKTLQAAVWADDGQQLCWHEAVDQLQQPLPHEGECHDEQYRGQGGGERAVEGEATPHRSKHTTKSRSEK